MCRPNELLKVKNRSREILPADCWLTVGQLSTDSFHYVSGQGFGLLSATSWLTEGDLLATCCDPLVTKSCADKRALERVKVKNSSRKILSAVCWLIVSRLSTDSFRYVSGQSFGLLTANSRPTVGDLLATSVGNL